MPLVLGMYVLLIYTAFFMYDRCIAEQDAYILCMREGTRKDEGPVSSPDVRRIQADEKRQHGTKFIALGGWSSRVYSQGSKAVYEGSGTCAPPVMQNIFPGEENFWRIRVRMSARKSDPPLLIRRYRRIQYIVSAGMQLP